MTSLVMKLRRCRGFLARPRAREPLKSVAGGLVKEATGEAKDGSFQEQSAAHTSAQPDLHSLRRLWQASDS